MNIQIFLLLFRSNFTTIIRKHKAKTIKEVHGTCIDWEKLEKYETLLEDLTERSEENESKDEQEMTKKHRHGKNTMEGYSMGKQRNIGKWNVMISRK